MAVFDVNNPPAIPDSSLDSDMTLVENITIEGNVVVPIAPGDWVDINPNALVQDPNWGWSFQVCNVYNDPAPANQMVGILYSIDNGLTYSEVDFSAFWVQQNFRRVPEVTE